MALRTASKVITLQGLRRAIIYEDNHLVAINKWRALAVQDADGSPEALVANLSMLRRVESDRTPQLAHRLDRNTTGVLLMAKTKAALSRLNHLFAQRAIAKEYVTVVVGKPPSKTGDLLGLGSVQLDPSERLFKATKPQAYSTSSSNQKSGAWGINETAQSHYEVLRHSGKYALSLLRLFPSTGYKHQLRIQCAELLGCPMLGDKRYGGDEFHPSLRPRLKQHGLGSEAHPHGVLLHLHAAKLTVPGYLADGGDLVLEAPLPEHMRLTIAACGLKHPSIGDIEHYPQQAASTSSKHSTDKSTWKHGMEEPVRKPTPKDRASRLSRRATSLEQDSQQHEYHRKGSSDKRRHDPRRTSHDPTRDPRSKHHARRSDERDPERRYTRHRT
eukprot:m.212524 g.212524  ORF g.212524 m.212524 type:complete len:386 (+) comp17164_c0_seq2:3-1160(+)